MRGFVSGFSHRLSSAHVIALIALVAAAGGGAYAATGELAASSSVIRACVNKRTGVVRALRGRQRCRRRKERPLAWNQKGVAGTLGRPGTPGTAGTVGPTGPTGTQGPQGTQGTQGNTGTFGSVTFRRIDVAVPANTPPATPITQNVPCLANERLVGGSANDSDPGGTTGTITESHALNSAGAVPTDATSTLGGQWRGAAVNASVTPSTMRVIAICAS